MKRLGDLEAIANSFEGIEKTYAIAAGREVRVFVAPLTVTDMQAHDLARNIAIKIEQEFGRPDVQLIKLIDAMRPGTCRSMQDRKTAGIISLTGRVFNQRH